MAWTKFMYETNSPTIRIDSFLTRVDAGLLSAGTTLGGRMLLGTATATAVSMFRMPSSLPPTGAPVVASSGFLVANVSDSGSEVSSGE
eukprot:CAMPEP_0197246944 /NCGR_PEP_ID=MMETSP1429-20130617/24359_1 /TAXON_ID=49237 /ORGANISM="Chaetoceros  sp., Strain UNC1202" /LENGTH=87 /DNA_ID=CAMNT_0042707737 /DNA_START=376 /DNA_END=639 /DNA_ORIENTATION=+